MVNLMQIRKQIESRQETVTCILKGVLASSLLLVVSYGMKLERIGVFCLALGGAGLGAVLDVVYGLILNIPNNVFNITFWEHYTWGLSFLAVASFLPLYWKLVVSGVGTYLITSEVFQVHPFSYRENTFLETTVVGLIVAIITLYLWLPH